METFNRMKGSKILIKGAGEKASAVAHRLYLCGFKKIVMTERRYPLAERRHVCFCEALFDKNKEVMGVSARKTDPSLEDIKKAWSSGMIAIAKDPNLSILSELRPNVFIDAVMSKRNTGTGKDLAPCVISLGPGFNAGVDAHYVIETNPLSNFLGGVITEGKAEKDTGIPPSVSGLDQERIIRSPSEGILRSHKKIGNSVEKGEDIGSVGGGILKSPTKGVIWGLVRDGVRVKKDQKIGDIDPRGDERSCHEITPHSRSIAGGVIEAVLRFHLC